MKISKKQLRQIIKEELRAIKETHGAHGDWQALLRNPAAMNSLDDALSQTLPVIEQAYNSLSDNETKAMFEEHLVKNIQLYVDKWREEREASSGDSDDDPGFALPMPTENPMGRGAQTSRLRKQSMNWREEQDI